MSNTPCTIAAEPAWIHRSEAFVEDLLHADDLLPTRPALRPTGRLLASVLPLCLALTGALVCTFTSVV